MVRSLLQALASADCTAKERITTVLPKRRRDIDPTPTPTPEDEYERVSVGEIQLVDAAPTVILPADPPSLSPMAVELEETVLALTKLPTPPASSRPSVAWIATIFSMSTMLSLGATSVIRAGSEAHGATAAAAGIVAPPPVMTSFALVTSPPVVIAAPEPDTAIASDAGHEEGVTVTAPIAEEPASASPATSD
ncbi:MAG: hypothetical protein JWO86_1691 [Myxococcaceae bacterium]|nr:hypothetical protein [Myxococcaceae bacterium]